MSSNLTLMLDNSFITQDYGFNEKGESFYRRILEKLSLEGKYCLMVGDNVENDIIPARKCGIHTARVLMGKYKKGNGKDEEDAEYKIQKVKDLLKIVPRLESQENGRLKSQIDFLVK